MSASYASRCYSCASLILLQLRKLDGFTLRRMAYTSAAVQHALQWFPPLCRFFRRRSAASQLVFAVAGALPSPVCCVLVQCAVASCSASVSFADSHSELSSSTNAWSTKYPSKDNLPLPLLARKRDNSETIGKAAVRQS